MSAVNAALLVALKVLLVFAAICLVMALAIYAVAKAFQRLLSLPLLDPWDDEPDEVSGPVIRGGVIEFPLPPVSVPTTSMAPPPPVKN
jgi:hypothetical protein